MMILNFQNKIRLLPKLEYVSIIRGDLQRSATIDVLLIFNDLAFLPTKSQTTYFMIARFLHLPTKANIAEFT